MKLLSLTTKLFFELYTTYNLEIRTQGHRARFIEGKYHIPSVLPGFYYVLENKLKG